MIFSNEVWKPIEYDSRYEVSNYGRFRKKLKNGNYRFLKPFHRAKLILVKIRDKDMNCARLVANAFIKNLSGNERVFHKNKNNEDNRYVNLEVISLKELGKRTGDKSKSQRVLELKGLEIVREWPSARKAAKELFISRQTVSDYCNKKVKKRMFNLVWEEDYFRKWKEM